MLALQAVLALHLLFALAAAASAAPIAGVVFVVIDGDTVLFKPDSIPPGSRAFLKIRLADIDAPEQGQPYGPAATRALSALVLNQQVEADTLATDVYGRTVARIRLGAVRIDQEMVRQGFAWAYGSTRASARSGAESFRASTWHRADPVLLDAQRAARSAHRGLWQEASPTPPWAWRRAQSAPVN
ncbi:MAG: thermonuclease family protein [Thiobacillus sp.]